MIQLPIARNLTEANSFQNKFCAEVLILLAVLAVTIARIL